MVQHPQVSSRLFFRMENESSARENRHNGRTEIHWDVVILFSVVSRLWSYSAAKQETVQTRLEIKLQTKLHANTHTSCISKGQSIKQASNQPTNHNFLEWPKYLKHYVHYRQCADTKCQISRMSGYASVNRKVLSWVRKVARGGADVSSDGQTILHLRASNRKCPAANSGAVNERLDESVAAGSRSAKPSATWKVSNVGKWARHDTLWPTIYVTNCLQLITQQNKEENRQACTTLNRFLSNQRRQHV